MKILIGDGKRDDTEAVQDFVDGKKVLFEDNIIFALGTNNPLQELPNRKFLITKPIKF